MIKDILVHIPTERSSRPVIDGSISLALTYGAHLDALAVGYVSVRNAFAIDGAAAIAAEAVEQERVEALIRARVAADIFELEARNAGISHSWRSAAAFPAEAAASLGTIARLYDLTVVLQPDVEHTSFDNMIPQEVLFQSGRPVLLIPYIFHGNFEARRIGICWDGSRLAARALRDAMPFLKRADKLLIIAIEEAGKDNAETSAEKLAQHLTRLNLDTTIRALDGSHSEIQPLISSLASDDGLDLLVMGGYGHARLQEALLGGVTRATLRSMTVPTLMSH
jgi:nucleotide-binding universal stress UspA family protein